MTEEEVSITVRKVFAKRVRGVVRYKEPTKNQKARVSFNISNPTPGEPVTAKFEEFRKLKELLNAETFSAVHDGKDAGGSFGKDEMISRVSILVTIEGLARE